MSPQHQNLDAHKADKCPMTMIKCDISKAVKKRDSVKKCQCTNRNNMQHMQHKINSYSHRKFETRLEVSGYHGSPIQRKKDALFLLAYAGGYGTASLMNDVSVYVHISYNDQL